MFMTQRSFRMIETNGVTLRVVVEGQGPLLLLLHGFPQCWYLWRHQIDVPRGQPASGARSAR